MTRPSSCDVSAGLHEVAEATDAVWPECMEGYELRDLVNSWPAVAVVGGKAYIYSLETHGHTVTGVWRSGTGLVTISGVDYFEDYQTMTTVLLEWREH